MQTHSSEISKKIEMVEVSSDVTLRVTIFSPLKTVTRPPIIFVPGWNSTMKSWGPFIGELAADFQMYYVETREKKSAAAKTAVPIDVSSIGADIVSLIDHYNFANANYTLIGSSLGSTAILDQWHNITASPLAVVLMIPNTEFAVPACWRLLAYMLPASTFRFFCPLAKTYMKYFMCNYENDPGQMKTIFDDIAKANFHRTKKALVSLSEYDLFVGLKKVLYPTLIIEASEDPLHKPDNIRRLASFLSCHNIYDAKKSTLVGSVNTAATIKEFIEGNCNY